MRRVRRAIVAGVQHGHSEPDDDDARSGQDEPDGSRGQSSPTIGGQKVLMVALVWLSVSIRACTAV